MSPQSYIFFTYAKKNEHDLLMRDKKKHKISDEALLHRARAYCAYQERCEYDMRERLRQWGVEREGVIESVINQLTKETFINDERFAKVYVGGRFRIKKWGRNKIAHALKKRRIKEEYISRALTEIDEKEYEDVLKRLIAVKWMDIEEKDSFIKQDKIARYMVGKGYEPELVWDVLKNGKFEI